MKKEMLINVLQPEECRIAIVEDGVLEELYVERTSHESYVGNIYKGRIVNIEPSIQAAFVDFGVGRNGFLHVSDVEPAYYRHLEPQRRPEGRDRGRGGNGRDRDRPRRPSRHGEGPPPRSRHREERVEEVTERAEDFRGEFLDAAPLHPEDMPATPDVAEELPPAQEAEAPPAAPEPEARGKERRRGRSGGRRRREEPAEAPAESSGEEAPPAGVPPPAEEPPPRSLPMDSAERRTEDEDDEPDAPQPAISDDDLFFPRQPAEEPPQRREKEPVQTADEAQERYEEKEERSEDEGPEPDSELEFDPGPEPETEPESEQEPRGHEEFDEERHLEEMADERSADFEEEEESEEPRRRSRRDDRRDDRRGGRRPRRMGGRPGSGRPKPLIQDIFKRGQEVLVQVIKEGIGTKGPTLSTYISIAGRYLVLMPGLNRIGVSRKIQDEEQRRRLREVLSELKPPKGLGFIIRTAGMDRNKKELQNDLAYLSRLWEVVVRRIRKMKAPAEIYQESDMITRTIRDTFTSEIETIWVDEPAAFEHAQEFLKIVMPRYASRIKQYAGSEPLFHKYGIEDEIARIQQRHVPLPNGGSIVIEQTEALVAIDVNSGNFRADNNAEETAYQMNLLAAKEIARQLRLRDLGGVIVNDFIDMQDERHRRGVEKAVRDAMKRDRARTKILKISAFGLIEMTRQRIRPSLKRSVYQDCPSCLGTGQVKTTESMSIDVMRLLQLAAHRDFVARVQVRVSEEVAAYLLNKKRREVTRLEETGNITVQVHAAPGAPPEFLEFLCYDNNNNEVKLPYPPDERSGSRPRRRSAGG
jgi:ribonuclease E